MSTLVRLSAVSFLVLPLWAACTVGSLGGPGDGSGTGSNPGSGSNPQSGQIQGTISSDQTWTGTVTIAGNTTIAAGVTVNVDPGTMIEGKAGVTVHVAGTLKMNGAKGQEVTILPVTGTPTWPGFVADAGGSVTMSHVMGTNIATLLYCHQGATCGLDHVDFSSLGQALVIEGTMTLTSSRLAQVAGGGVTITGGDLTVTDTYVLTSAGDIIVMNGGHLNMSYSEIGDAQGSYEHCDFHINSAASVSITHTNIRNGVYGFMIGGTTNAVITGDNFLKNGSFTGTARTGGADVDELSANPGADFSGDYWDQGTPTGLTGYNFGSPATAALADAGPRAANL